MDTNIQDGDDPSIDIKSSDTTWTEIKHMLQQFMVILPIILLSAISVFPLSQVGDQIIYIKLGGNVSDNGNESELCVAPNGSSKDNQDEVQSQATIFKLYMNVGSCLGGMISMPFWCGWSDTIGRQVGLLAAFTGFFIKTGCFLLIMLFDAVPIWILILSDISLGLLGKGVAMLFASASSFAADITPEGQRTLLMLTLEFIFLFSAAFGNIAAGICLKRFSYIPVLLAMMACHAVGIIYTILVFEKASLKVMKKSAAESSVIKYLMSTWKTFTRKRPERPYVRRLLFILESMLFIYYCGFMGSFNLFNIYTLGYPLCWGSTLIGIMNAVMVASSGVFPLLFGLLFFKHGPTPWLLLIGLSVAGAGCVLIGLSTKTWMMLLGVAMFALRALVSGTGRSILADIVDDDEIGAAMAGYGIVGISADLVSSVAFNAIYSSTLSFCKGCVFFVGAGCYATAILILAVFVLMRAHASKSSGAWRNLQEVANST